MALNSGVNGHCRYGGAQHSGENPGVTYSTEARVASDQRAEGRGRGTNRSPCDIPVYVHAA